MVSNADELLADVQEAMESFEGSLIDPAIFERTGVFVVRSALTGDELVGWQRRWDDYRAQVLGANRELENTSNPVDVRNVPDELYELSRSDAILDLLEPVFGPDIGLYQKRFVVKDSSATGPVILHQDSGYHVGTFAKASVFVALTPVSADNGAMFVYPGTHHFGYLGDAGSINPDVLPAGWPKVTPTLEPGDLMVMRSLLWHGSVPFVRGKERVMTDFIYQPAGDPSTREVVRGSSGWQGSFLTERRADIFVSSRSSKLRAIKGVLDSTT